MDSLKFETYQFRDIPNCNLNFDFPIVGFNGVVDHNKFEGGLKIIGCTYDVENEEETEVEVGEIEFHAYNLSKLGFDYSCKDFKTADKGSKLYLAMDIDEPEFALYYSVFSRGYDKVVKPLNVEDLSDIFSTNADAYLITLDRFYIYEKYRKQGIATFIQKNFFKIFYSYFNIVPIFMVGICAPDDDEPEGMLKVQKKVFKKNGFYLFECFDEVAFCKYIYDKGFLEEINM